MARGDVKEGKGGIKYVQVGDDPKDRNSWQEFKPEPEKPSRVMQGLNFANKAAETGLKMNPLMYAVTKAGESVSPENAYDVGGKVTDLTGSPELGVAANFMVQAIPTILSGTAAKSAAESILKPAGRRLMQSAVNPSKASVLSGDAPKAIETMLKEGVNVSSGGMAKLSKQVEALSAEVDDIINAAEKSGASVSKVSMLRSWAQELKKIAGPLDSADDVAQAKGVLERVLSDPRIQELDNIPVRMAQDLKTATYRSLGEKAYNQADNMTTATISSLKSVIRGLKEGIERAAPGVVPKNQRMSELLNAIEVVEPRALTAGGKNIGGLASLAENPFAGGMFMLDRSSLAKSILGRFLYSGAPSIVGNTARAGTAVGMGGGGGY